MLETLTEADSGVDNDILAQNSRIKGKLNLSRQEIAYFR
jgi:hypothetical protein